MKLSEYFLSIVSKSIILQSGLNQEIKAAGGTTLHQACVVRWLSLSDLLESVVKSFKITKRVLFNQQKQNIMSDLNEQTLKQLVFLLKPFKIMIKIILCGNAPSLHLVSLCYITLKEVLSSYESLKQYNADNSDQNEVENSELFNDFDLENELPGNCFKKMRTYESDRFPFRNNLVSSTIVIVIKGNVCS